MRVVIEQKRSLNETLVTKTCTFHLYDNKLITTLGHPKLIIKLGAYADELVDKQTKIQMNKSIENYPVERNKKFKGNQF